MTISSPGPLARASRRAVLALQALAAVALAGCSFGGPEPTIYVLGNALPPTESRQQELGMPVIELERVRVPDYLDTTDLLRRDGSRLISSRVGRWGERLSLGVTQALAADCAPRLPQFVLTTIVSNQAAQQLLVDVQSFEARSDKEVVLVADWQLIDRATGKELASERQTLVETIDGKDDAAAVAAMSRAVDHLAAGIAPSIRAITTTK